MLFDIDKKDPQHPALVEESGAEVGYGILVSIFEEIHEVIPKRELVFCLCRNVNSSLAGFLALYDNKDVCLLLSDSIDRALLSSLDETYQPSYYWKPENSSIPVTTENVYQLDEYVLCKTGRHAPEMDIRLSMLMTTSGTTGSPKLVRYKYGNIESNAKNVASIFGWSEEERGILDLPMQYTMGLNVICSHLYAGATVLLTGSSLMNPQFWAYIKQQQGTNFTGVPFSYEVLKKLRFQKMDLPYLKTMAEGGGKMSDELFASFAKFAAESGKRFFATFGTTETSARLAYLEPEEATTHCGSIGKAIPEGKLYLIDETGNKISSPDVEGELVYEGPNVTMGYAESKQDLQKGEEFDGVYQTGDLAKMDNDGNYYIVGRKKRFLKLFGLRVSLDQVESMITEEFQLSCACTGNDQIMDIFIESKTMKKEVLEFVSTKTGLLKKSFEVHSIERIPRFESGKINYKQLNFETL